MSFHARRARAIVLASVLFPFSSAPTYESIRIALHRIGARTTAPVIEIDTSRRNFSTTDRFFDYDGDLILDHRKTYGSDGHLIDEYHAPPLGNFTLRSVHFADERTRRAQKVLVNYVLAH